MKVQFKNSLNNKNSQKSRRIKIEGQDIGDIPNSNKKTLLSSLNIKGIKVKIILSFLLPVILIIVLGFTSYLASSKGMRNNYEASTITSMKMATNYFDVILNDLTNKIIQLSADDSVKKYFSGYYKEDTITENLVRKEIVNRVLASSNTDKFISNMYLISDYGMGISVHNQALSDIFSEINESAEIKEFIASNQNGYYLTSHPTFDINSNTSRDSYSFSYITYLRNTSNSKIGYIIVDLKAEAINNLLTNLDFGQSSIVGIVAGKDYEILNGAKTKDFQFESQSFYQNAIKGKDNMGYKYVSYNGKTYLFAYSKIEKTNMVICSLIPQATIIKQSETVKNITIIIVLVACFVAIIIGTIMASGISKTIHRTNEVLEKAGNGDLTADIKTKRKDEFNILSKCINNMITSMKNIIYKMTTISNTVSSSAMEVSNNSEILLKASQDISLAIDEIKAGISQQSCDSESCLNQMEDLADQITSVYQNTTEIGNIANDTKNIIGDGIIIINDLNSKAKDTSNITQTIIDDIEKLDNESSYINSIIETINSISTQTNLLSLNASIEAARAGEAGKGFAVVASEIGKLAHQSSDAANQIGSIIQQIQERTKQTVKTTKQAEAIVNSQEGALIKTINVFDTINMHVENLISNLNNISNGISSIERAKNDTLGAIENITATSEETTAASNNLGETAVKQLEAVESLNKAANGLQEDAINLNDTVKIFKIH